MPIPARPLLLAAAFLLAACAPTSAPGTPDTPSAPRKPVGASDFEAAIARLEQRDPQSPESLNARLQYADFLTDATTGDCHARLDTAQAQLDALASQPALPILLSLGPAKLASARYRIHAARADCDAASRADELHQALEAARQATGLYRQGRDYQSAAIMQFNVAATLHALGDQQAALVALQAVIAMDRAFGFRDDAQDNIKLLQHWQGGDESDAHITQLMADFPAGPPVAFNFGWSQSDARVAIDATETNFVEGKIIQSTGAITVDRHVRPDGLSWTVSTDPATPTFSLGDWPADRDLLKRFTGYLLALALMETPKYEVHKNGDFDAVRDAHQFSTDLSAAVSARLGAPPADHKILASNIKAVLSPDYLETSAGEKYSLETATWAGAKLEQGVWYQMTAPLFLPGLGLGELLVTHDIAFSYARAVPCTADDTAKACAEIIVHATPEPTDLRKVCFQIASDFHLAAFDALHYWATTDLRLVVKPDTLTPYVSDMRRNWYVAVDGAPKDETLYASERIVATSTYH